MINLKCAGILYHSDCNRVTTPQVRVVMRLMKVPMELEELGRVAKVVKTVVTKICKMN